MQLCLWTKDFLIYQVWHRWSLIFIVLTDQDMFFFIIVKAMLNYWGLSSVTTSKQLYFSLLLSFLCFVSKEESSTGFLRTLVTWTLCFHGRLWTSPRWVSPRQVWWLALQHREAISCLAKPALWSGSPNLETITVGLPASAAQCLHRFNKSVHIDWGRGSPSVTQQKSSENMYGD